MGDSVAAVRIAAAGALRNVSLVGGVKATEKLAEVNCVESILSTLHQV